jgi:4-amino-4-deoxy-L-arabinose transferase-like glycosyltransferase
MNQKAEKTFFEKYEFLIPFMLLVIFLALTLPGISWGAPNVWHPDEIVVRSIKALFDAEYRFDEVNFDYPTLPQYVMYGLGKVVIGLGYSEKEILVSARVLSAILAGITIIITYLIARRVGGSIPVAGLSGLLLICVSEMEHNGRFAHNDTFIIFFTTLAVLCIIEYFNKQNKFWLYGSFIAVGMAASSKYIGGSLFIVPLAVYLIGQRKNLRTEPLPVAETLFISIALTFLGFAAGTPKALFWMTYYVKRLLPALEWQAAYGRQPGSQRGILGQYGVLTDGLGWPLMLLFSAAFVWACYHVVQAYHNQEIKPGSRKGAFAILLFAILVLDLPMMFSYNYQLRYFLTLMPLLAVLAAYFVEALYMRAELMDGRVYLILVGAGVSVIILYSLARIVSLMLLVVNDARIPASAFIQTLRVGTSLEHTNYPPVIPGNHFEREHNYPIYFVKGNEPLPTNKRYDFNAGEVGLDDRGTDYLITDSFTYDRFSDPYICTSMQAECDFFEQLDTGKSAHYKLIAEFSYSLPSYLPQIQVLFVNPVIRVYERIQ